jgi:HEPN domain-containing protein
MEQAFNQMGGLNLKAVDLACMKIIAMLNPERIIGLAIRTSKVHSWSVFKSKWNIDLSLVVDLLIVVRSTDSQELHQIEDIISHLGTETLQLNPMVHKASYVKKKVEEGDDFFCRIHQTGSLLFEHKDATAIQPLPWNIINAGDQILRLQALHDNWTGRARQSLHESIRIIAHGYYLIGLTLLLQAAEYACIGILRVGMGYNPPTRNLRKLLKLAACVSTRADTVFPGNTKQEAALLDVLLKAHRNARYKEDYAVPEGVADILVERVQGLLQIADDVYAECTNELVAFLPVDDITES